uniref:Uncharacterized protein n=1 Tax=Panagrolaimus sp. PS1159 TaxID=55785 RepID=A0AC35GH48_9BILA
MSSTSVGQIRTLPNPVNEQEIITFPFQIDFTGEADLDTYLQPEENENGVISGTFRGRPLFGEKVIPPENFDTVTVTTELRPTGQTLVNVTGTVKNILSYEYDRQPSKYTRLQKTMARCENNEWQKKEYLPELESDEIALNFIKSLQYPDLFENEDDEATSKGEQFYAWMEVMGLKGRKKEEDSKENVTVIDE